VSSANIHFEIAKLPFSFTRERTEVMERRDFLKLTLGFVAGGAVLAASARAAAPLPPISSAPVPAGASAEPAVVSQDDVDHIKPEQVRWHHHGHGHWHHRGHWHRHWHRRHWGWHHRRRHRHHWRHHRHW
jgi:hypothetical protein